MTGNQSHRVTGINPGIFANIAVCLATLAVLFNVLCWRRRMTSAAFTNRVTTVTVVCCMLLGYYYVGYGRILGPYIGEYNKKVSAQIHIDDPEFYRMESTDSQNNINMLWGMSSLKSFTSIIPSSTFELYDLLDIKRDVNSKPETEHYALRALTLSLIHI